MPIDGEKTITLEEWPRLKAFVGLDQNDIDILKSLRPLAEQAVDPMIDEIYEIFIRFDETHSLLRKAGTLDRLKNSQREYFLELFSGDYGDAYFESRLRVGQVHHHVGLTPQWYLTAYCHYQRIFRPYIFNNLEPAAAMKAFDSVHRIITLDKSLAINTYVATGAQAKEELISQQHAEIIEISTPVVQVWDGVVLATIIGTLNSDRSRMFMERLLECVVNTRSPVALIDITGVPTIDTATAQHLIDTISAVRLLGSHVVITGISPAIAQTLVHLGIDLTGINTRASLAGGLRVALDMLNLEIQTRQAEVE